MSLHQTALLPASISCGFQLQPVQDHIQRASLWFNVLDVTPESMRPLGVELPCRLIAALPKRKAEFLVGRYCAASAVRAVTQEWQVPGVDENRAPIWPAGIVGSITHTNGYAAAVATRASNYKGIGIDSEAIVSPKRVDAVTATALKKCEVNLLLAAGLPLTTAVTLGFSCKESLYKAFSPLVGGYFGFEAAEIVDVDIRSTTIVLIFTKNVACLVAGQKAYANFRIDDHQLVHTMVAVPTF